MTPDPTADHAALAVGGLADLDDMEPTAADLDAIEAEWPLIEADLAVLDAEISALSHAGGPTPLDWRRMRRAQNHLLSALAAYPALVDEHGEVA